MWVKFDERGIETLTSRYRMTSWMFSTVAYLLIYSLTVLFYFVAMLVDLNLINRFPSLVLTTSSYVTACDTPN